MLSELLGSKVYYLPLQCVDDSDKLIGIVGDSNPVCGGGPPRQAYWHNMLRTLCQQWIKGRWQLMRIYRSCEEPCFTSRLPCDSVPESFMLDSMPKNVSVCAGTKNLIYRRIQNK